MSVLGGGEGCAARGGRALSLESRAVDYPASGEQPPTFSLYPGASPSSAPVPPLGTASAGPSLERSSTPSSCRRSWWPHQVGGGGGGVANSGFRIPLRPLAASFRPQGFRSPGVGRDPGVERKNAALQLRGHRTPRVPIDPAVCPRERDGDRPPEPGAGAWGAKLKLEADLIQK